MLKTEIDPLQKELTDEQNESIAKEAMEEYESEREGRNLNDLDKEDDEPVEGAEPEVKDEPIDIVVVPDEKPVKEPESEPNESEEVKAYADKHELTEVEAKEDIAKNKSILEKYKSPEEMARALRSTQSAYDKLKSEKAQIIEEPDKPALNVNIHQEIESHVEKHLSENSEKLVEQYKVRYPKKTEYMDDDVILEEVKERMVEQELGRYHSWLDQKQVEVKELASNKRIELLEGLSDSDKEVLPDIKKVLDDTQDDLVINKSFVFKDILRWARGDEDRIKKIEKDAYERGKKEATESATILGDRVHGSPKSSGKGTIQSTSLNGHQKARAIEMFDHIEGADDDKYEMYRDTYKSELKNNPRFLG